MTPATLRRLLEGARLPESVDVASVGGYGHALHDSATGEPIAFTWPRAELVMTLVNAAPALLAVLAAAEDWDECCTEGCTLMRDYHDECSCGAEKLRAALRAMEVPDV